ncbi:hypothetical protein ACHAWU_006110 [Discostella pseudostelligera]|uniref:Uncharacterized protein n=1 Tax=Discostella pseudostelligera TaxID=259834 RepID=A0ABD3M9B0_9STRA
MICCRAAAVAVADDEALAHDDGEREGAIFLVGNHIRDKGVARVVDALNEPCCRKYYKLYLCDNRVGRLGASCISTALNHNTTLRELSLGNNHIGDEGARYLANSLTHNGTLEMLNLEKNSIGPIGIIALANALEHDNSSLKWLVLSENPIGDEGVKSMLRCVGNTSSFERLQNCNHCLLSVTMRKATQVDDSTATIRKMQSYLKINRLSANSSRLVVQRKVIQCVRENHHALLEYLSVVQNRDGLKEVHCALHILALLGEQRDLSTMFAVLKNTPQLFLFGNN